MTSTKSHTQSSEPEKPEIDYAELILRRFKMVRSQIEEAAAYNESVGLPLEFAGHYTGYTEHPLEKHYQKWLDTVTVPDSNPRQFYNREILKLLGRLPKRASPQDNIEYPRVEIHGLHRIQTSKGDFLKRIMTLYALDITAHEVALGISDCDYYYEIQEEFVLPIPGLTYHPAPNEQSTCGVNSIYENLISKKQELRKAFNVAPGLTAEDQGVLTWLTPFSIETVQQFLQNGSKNGVSFSIEKEGYSQRFGIPTLEEFLGPFESLWQKNIQPNRNTFSVDPELLKKLGEMYRQNIDQTNQNKDHFQ